MCIVHVHTPALTCAQQVIPSDSFADSSSTPVTIIAIAVVVVLILAGVGGWYWKMSIEKAKEGEEDACSSDPSVFLCHHKAGAGGFARLLKLMLLERKITDIFLDRYSTCLLFCACDKTIVCI